MGTLNPRDGFAANFPSGSGTCRVYDEITGAASNDKLFAFELQQPEHVQYVHAMGSAWHGGDRIDFLTNDWDGNNGNCDILYQAEDPSSIFAGFSNILWFGAKAYVGDYSNQQFDQLTECGYVGSDRLVKYEGDVDALDRDDYRELIKMGGSVKCPDDAGLSSHVVIMFTED